MRKKFYEKALPSQGVYCVASIDKNEKIEHYFVETLSDLDEKIDELEREEVNVFVALNSFSGYTRKADYAMYCRSFFIDLDVDPENPRKYASKEAALASIADFVQICGLPPPVRVDSGGGVHAYWLFDSDIPTEEWKVYAQKFKSLCLDYMKIDPAVTADAARILRAPETTHRKAEPKPVKFLDDDFGQYVFEEFKQYLGVVEPSLSSILNSVQKGLDDDTKKIAKVDNYETTFQEVAEKSLGDQGCPQIKNILLNAEMLEEPLWYAGLSIARHCTDWETAIHLLSEDHPEYNHESTTRKANQAFGKPFSCEKFDELNPGGCEGCVFKGRITNPLAIGRKLATAPTSEEITQEDAIRVEENPEEVPVFPDYLKPFVRGRTGGLYFLPPTEEDENGNRLQPNPVLISNNDFFPIKRKYSSTGGEMFVMRIVMPHEVREFDMPMEAINSLELFKRSLGREGIAPPFQAQWPKLVEYMTKWAHYLQSKAAAEQVRGQMGWTEDTNAFVMGAVEIDRKQNVRKAAISPLVKGVSKMLEPKGDYKVWQDCANELNRPEFEMHAFGLMMAFGSPLMRFCTTKGMTYCFTGNTGSAKSGALIAAVSVFADPVSASIFKATDNAYVQRALNFKNIILGIDEVKDKDPKELSNLIHSVAQGKGKIRMQASVNAEREQELSAALISLWTSNESMVDKLFTSKRNPTGEMARYMEYRIPRPRIFDTEKGAGERIFNPFNTNYGHAGPEYIKYLMQVGDGDIQSRLEKWHNRITDSRFGADASYRFFVNATAASFAGGELARKAGIVELDVERIFDFVMLQSIMVRDKTVKDHTVDYEALLNEFLNNNHNGILIFNEGHTTSTIYGPLLGRVELDKNRQYISKTAFRKFIIEECRVSTDEMESVLKAKGILVGTDKMRLSTGWKGGTFGPVACYEFKAELPKEFVEKFVNDRAT